MPSIPNRTVASAGALLFALGLSSAARAQSPLDGFDPGANGRIRTVVQQPDGKVLVGGDFTMPWVAPEGVAYGACSLL